MPYQAYIEKMREVIKEARVDLTPENQDMIIDANAPRQYVPAKPAKIGILLVHGLFDSPHMMLSLFNHFKAHDYLVRSILLPGHGTVPGDLLSVSYHAWISAIEYGINSLLEEVEQVFIVGFSMGGLLSLSASYEYDHIAGVILIAPALKIRNPFVVLSEWYEWLSRLISGFKWAAKGKDDDYAKYQSHTANAVTQIREMIKHLEHKIARSKLTMPVFIAASDQDEIIDTDAIETFFSTLSNPRNKLLIYSNKPRRTKGRVYFRPSRFPDHNIVDFSHICICIAEDHPHYGKNGDYKDVRHYNHWWARLHQKEASEWHFGAVNLENLRRYQLARLSYNPDFPNLVKAFDQFIQDVR